MADAPPEPILESLVQRPQPENVAPKPPVTVVPTPKVPPPSAKPMLQAESPSLGKRQDREEASAVDGAGQNLAAKRVRPDQAPVKVLPTKYEFCEVHDMVVLIANMIQELIETNDELPLRQGVLTRFHSR